ncbi:MAG TPA: hypothetical protein VHG89_00540 [Verrucomicrobiae bacterium]|nr:hypothetical protein [Verrucomicrobiae bacterium]
MRLNWSLVHAAIFVALALFATGCGGVNAGTTVSPATFLLPGILKTDTPTTNAPVAATEISKEFALTK